MYTVSVTVESVRKRIMSSETSSGSNMSDSSSVHADRTDSLKWARIAQGLFTGQRGALGTPQSRMPRRRALRDETSSFVQTSQPCIFLSSIQETLGTSL